MNYAVFKCATRADKKLKHSQDCTVMIRCAIGGVSNVSRHCRWCQAGTAYYANGALQRSREESRK